MTTTPHNAEAPEPHPPKPQHWAIDKLAALAALSDDDWTLIRERCPNECARLRGLLQHDPTPKQQDAISDDAVAAASAAYVNALRRSNLSGEEAEHDAMYAALVAGLSLAQTPTPTDKLIDALFRFRQLAYEVVEEATLAQTTAWPAAMKALGEVYQDSDALLPDRIPHSEQHPQPAAIPKRFDDQEQADLDALDKFAADCTDGFNRLVGGGFIIRINAIVRKLVPHSEHP